MINKKEYIMLGRNTDPKETTIHHKIHVLLHSKTLSYMELQGATMALAQHSTSKDYDDLIIWQAKTIILGKICRFFKIKHDKINKKVLAFL